MALTDESNNGFYMPVAPAYGGGNGGFGGGWNNDWAWIIILLLAFNGGWGNGFGGMGGYGNMMLGYDFPWLLNGQNNLSAQMSGGFQNAQISDGITSIRDGISGLSTQLCGCCGDMQMALANGFNSAEIAANNRQMANMQQAYNLSAQIASASADNRLGIANLAADISRENCADREALNYGVRDIINNQTAGIQRILDKLCDQELQAERRDNANLRSELMFARGQASQIEQNAFIAQGFANEVDALYNRLSNCPVPSTPVYGRTPIFTCGNNGCGCGCGNM